MGLKRAGPAAGGDLLEGSAAIAEHDARAPVRVLREEPLDLGIDVPRDVEDVGPAVVVEIGKSGSPLHVPVLHGQAGRGRRVRELAAPEVAIEGGYVVGEVCLEEIEAPVEVE